MFLSLPILGFTLGPRSQLGVVGMGRMGQSWRMLRCGPSVFAGNAGYRLPLPASFPAGLPLGEQPPEGQWQHRAEVQIARKLQCIADQFHRLHMQQVGMGAWGGGESSGAGGPGPASATPSAKPQG